MSKETSSGNKPIASQTPSVPAVQTEDFRSRYANNARFEATVFDLKILFGETDLKTGSEIVQQHTAVTIPWALVKVLIYWLQVNFEVTEATVGKVAIPPTQIPPPPVPLP